MAKILISSAALAEGLSSFSPKEKVTIIELCKTYIYIGTNAHSLTKVKAEPSKIAVFYQEDRRWDKLFEVVKSMPDQPIILDINDNILNLIIQF